MDGKGLLIDLFLRKSREALPAGISSWLPLLLGGTAKKEETKGASTADLPGCKAQACSQASGECDLRVMACEAGW